jgi:hypothetical protein
MTALRLALLLAAAALPACVDSDGSSTDPAPSSAAACAPEPYGNAEILACGFGPKLALVGGDTDRLYAVSEAGTYYAVDYAGVTTKLFHNYFGQNGTAQRGAVIHDGHIIVPSNIDDGDSISAGLISIDGSAASDAPTVLMRGDQFEPTAGLVDSGSLIYASSIEHVDFGASSGRVVAINYDGGHLAPVTPDSGTPIGISNGFLYYLHDLDARRIPLAGGAAETVAANIAFTAWGNRSIDSSYLYGSPDDSPYDLVGFPIAGGSPHALTTLTSNAEVPTSPAHDLHIDGDWLYYMTSGGEDPTSTSYVSLWRIRLDGTGDSQVIAQQQDMLAPLFDDEYIYVAYTRGGYDTPIEGVVARIPKQPHCNC